jgi:hypothetical protein
LDIREQTVEEFWRRINEEGLTYKSENKLAKILKLVKVRNHITHDFIKGLMHSSLQDGIIS